MKCKRNSNSEVVYFSEQTEIILLTYSMVLISNILTMLVTYLE